MLKNLTIRKQLTLGFGFAIVTTVVIAAISIIGLNAVGQHIDESAAGKYYGNANNGLRVATAAIAIMTFACVLFAAAISFRIIRGITVPLNEAVLASKRVAEGDLTVDPQTGGSNEIGQLMSAVKRLAEKQKKVIGDLKSTSDNVTAASQQLSTSSEQMSRGVTEQSGRASQIATAANQMSQTVVDIAKNSSCMASSATETAKIASDGEEIVRKSVEEVKAIADTVNDSAKLIASLGERSRQIGNIINVIKDIADQTNLLALNAAIEAARAGEQGRGFAVVADEVRKLAERTAKATSEIGEMIGAIQLEIDMAVRSMENGTARVDTGVDFSLQAGDALGRIVASVKELQSMVQQIAAATEEMSTASEQINGDIEMIANISQEASSNSGQVIQASSDLARFAVNLQGVTASFKVS